jgi:hypothetical protein
MGRRGEISEYSIQLREKQKVKRMYGLFESQFRRTFAEAARIRASPARRCWLLERWTTPPIGSVLPARAPRLEPWCARAYPG